MFDLAAYFARLRLPTPVAPDVAGLQALHRAHRLAIPFENLDVALGRPIAIGSAAVFAKLVTAGRGGFCFEHHRLFADALAALGFAERPLLARVLLGVAPDAPAPPLNHVLSLIDVAGEEWIADAGFGGSYAPPLPLIDGARATATDGAEVRLTRAGDDWLLERRGDPGTTDGRGGAEGWQPQYRFATAAVTAADLADGCRRAESDPASRFVRHRLAAIVLPHGFARLTDQHYRRQVGDAVSEGEIADARVYRMRLSLMFGIDLTREEVAALGLF